MIITNETLQNLRTMVRGEFATQMAALFATELMDKKLATGIQSNTRSNTYGWLGDFPALREWVGGRAADIGGPAYRRGQFEPRLPHGGLAGLADAVGGGDEKRTKTRTGPDAGRRGCKPPPSRVTIRSVFMRMRPAFMRTRPVSL
jgi:hypothetical protein